MRKAQKSNKDKKYEIYYIIWCHVINSNAEKPLYAPF